MFWLHTARPTCSCRGENRQIGDRDGLPMCCWKRRANASLRRDTMSGIPELIEHESTGIAGGRPAMRQPRAAIAGLIRDPERRARSAPPAWRGCGAI